VNQFLVDWEGRSGTMPNMKLVFFIGLGGFLGAIARYGLNAGVHAAFGERASGFPVGTLVINVIGCFVLGFAARFLTERVLVAHELRLALTVGFLAAKLRLFGFSPNDL
jgi:CrcB protein